MICSNHSSSSIRQGENRFRLYFCIDGRMNDSIYSDETIRGPQPSALAGSFSIVAIVPLVLRRQSPPPSKRLCVVFSRNCSSISLQTKQVQNRFRLYFSSEGRMMYNRQCILNKEAGFTNLSYVHYRKSSRHSE